MKIIDVPQGVLELILRQEADTSWPMPEPINHALIHVRQFEPDMLPDSLRAWIMDIAHRMQCAVDFVAAAAMVMLGSIIGTGCAIRPKQNDNWTEVPNIWGAAIGRPGRLKSPAISAAMGPLYKLDGMAQKDYQSAMATHEQAMMNRKFSMELLRKNIGRQKGYVPGVQSAEEVEYQRLNALPTTEPVLKRHYSNDCTMESLGEMMQGNPRGILVQHDELTGLFATFERPGREGERQGYLTAWNGLGSHRVDRIGRGHIYIERFCASIFGGIQPDKLERFLADAKDNYDNDGFIQRVQVMVYPDDIGMPKVIDQSPDAAAQNQAFAVIEKLALHIDVCGGQQDDTHDLPYFRFEKKSAQVQFFAWLDGLTKRIDDEEAALMQEHLGKYRKLIPALALIFHLVEIAAGEAKPGSPIPTKTLQKAICWDAYLESHARRVYGMATDYKLQAAKALALKIQGRHLTDGFNARTVTQKGWSRLTDADDIKAGCSELEAANWIRKIQTERKGTGRSALPTYEINPRVFEMASAGGVPTKPTKRARRGAKP